jgi:hypothetical protein
MANNKFTKVLTQSFPELRAQRADNQSSMVEVSQMNLINSLKNQYLTLQNKLESLTDLGPSTTVDLKGPNIDPQQWVKDVQGIKVQLLEVEVQLNIAIETYEEWFTEVKVPVVSPKPVARKHPRTTARKATKK